MLTVPVSYAWLSPVHATRDPAIPEPILSDAKEQSTHIRCTYAMLCIIARLRARTHALPGLSRIHAPMAHRGQLADSPSCELRAPQAHRGVNNLFDISF